MFATTSGGGAEDAADEQMDDAEDMELDDPDQPVLQPPPLPQRLPGLSLADAIPQAAGPQMREDTHMQPAVMKVLEAVRSSVQSSMILADTHSTSPLLFPLAKPDALALASALTAWTQVAVLFEFKLTESATQLATMMGQHISRARAVLDQQPRRPRVVCVGLTMNSLEVVVVHRLDEKAIRVERTGLQPFSISSESLGFQLLVQVFSTSMQKLGFVSHALPDLRQLGHYPLSNLQLLRLGTAPGGQGSLVYSAEACEPRREQWQAILKLNRSSKEVRSPADCSKLAKQTNDTGGLWQSCA